MKLATLDGKEVTVNQSIAHNASTKQRGYIYTCSTCGGAARVHKHSHRGNDGHFEHRDWNGTCPEMQKR